MSMTTEEVLCRLEEGGFEGRIVSTKRLCDLKKEIEEKRRQGLLNPELHDRYFSHFEFEPEKTMKGADSIMVVAIPRPLFQVTFTWKGKKIPAIIPPTHLFLKDTTTEVENLLTEVLEKDGYRFVRAWLP